MKYQDLKPWATIDPPVDTAFSYVSKLQTIELGLHWSSVSEATVADAFSISLSFSRATCATARATDDVGTSAATSTPLSNHCRAIAAATSGLFWWSALMTSTSQSSCDFISSTASCVAASDVGPVLSR